MIDTKKYMITISVFLGILIVSGLLINFFISTLAGAFKLGLDILILILILIVLLSIKITNDVVKDRPVKPSIMKFNFKVVTMLFPIVTIVANLIKIPKNEIRKVYVKLNNRYIYSNNYNFKSDEILILIPHCIQKSSCKLKVTNKIENCATCGLCNVGDLVRLKEKTKVNIFIATGGTLARKIIMDNKPKAVIAVACERDLTAGVQDMRHIPVLGVFNKRPNGPCVDTSIDIKEVEDAINFFISTTND